MKESDLYIPIKELFTELGYDVKAEVGEIDVMATKDSEMVIIELKKELNLKLITQGAKRQKMTDTVYLAIPKPSYKIRNSKNYKDKTFILSRLGLGLVYVDFKEKETISTIEMEPVIFNIQHAQKINKRTKERALKEKSLRSGDYNLGGQQGKKMTVYKENTVHIVGLLKQNGEMKLSEIKSIAGDKTDSILQKNFYNWFERVKKGHYKLSEAGEQAYYEYADIIKILL